MAWQLQETKERLSELVRRTPEEGPRPFYAITRTGSYPSTPRLRRNGDA